ncbi:unnamed protein product [Didymodactylos carnosus]|uniref:Actin-related protein 2 n=1 Tax=Didymodactylos carnosus TaxID=1234261 RepID=A0A813W8U5_9BILA|nr:unnamed protein product [Didymodactylos carnosus]CAF3639246.1 unnamed protein product [Didymodactylos carnosus]
MVGRPQIRSRSKVHDIEVQDIMVGDEAQKVRQMLDIRYPVENGIVQDWEDMKHIYNYLFSSKKMNIDPKDCKILLTEAPLNPVKNRAKMLEVMLEQFQFSEVSLAYQAILTLYAQGILTGVVVDIGDGVTHICPVVDGYCLQNSIARLNIAGRDITRYLIKILLLRGYVFNQSADFDTVQQIKEKLCYVAHDLEKERQLTLDTTVLVESYVLPDGRTVKMSGERFEAPEVLFRPSLLGMEVKGIAELVFEVINTAPLDVRKKLYKQIVLSGGTTMYPGFGTRLERELEQLYHERIQRSDPEKSAKNMICIEAPPRRKNMVFLGGAVYANLVKDSPVQWISRKDYYEHGVDSFLNLNNIMDRNRWISIVLCLTGIIFVVSGIVLIVIGDSTVKKLMNKELQLKEGTLLYNNWVSSPVPIYLFLYVFDLKNVDEFLNGSKPVLYQRGPFVYRENRTKINIVSNANQTISYQEPRTYTFDRSRSSEDVSTTTFTTINVVYMTLLNYIRTIKSTVDRRIIGEILSSFNEKPVMKRTVHEYLWGYTDPLLSLAKSMLPDLVTDDQIAVFGQAVNMILKYMFITTLLKNFRLDEFCRIRCMVN